MVRSRTRREQQAATSRKHLRGKTKALGAAMCTGALVIACAGLPGCASESQQTLEPERSTLDANTQRVTAKEDAGLREWQTAFACNSSAFALSATEGNACYSPLSMYYGLALLQQGAEGESLDELIELLGAPSADVAEGCRSQMGQLAAYAEREAIIELANSIWIRDDLAFSKAYEAAVTSAFDAEAAGVPFGEASANQQVSDWIADKTHDLLHPQFDFTADALMCLVNALYFKADWSAPFDAEFTEDADFETPSGTVAAPFMHTSNHGGFAETDGFTASRLSLRSGATMSFYLPSEGKTPRDLVSTPESVMNLLGASLDGNREVIWSLPKFSFDVEYQMVELLQSMGLRAPFQAGMADFNGMLADQAFAEANPPYVSKVVQGCSIDVNEEGVEAAAQTTFEMYAGAAAQQEPPVEFVLDRPFLFTIQTSDGTVLFMGIVENPQA